MSTDASWRVQVSPKTPSGTLINVRGDNQDEVKAGLDIVSSLAGDIASTEALLNGAAVVAHTQAAPRAQGAPPPQAPPAAPAPAPKTCPHGQRQWRTGSSARGPWGAWFCPTPKGTPGQCDPEWDRSYGK